METVTNINPATGEKIKEYKRITASEAKNKVEEGKKAFDTWKKTSYDERSKLMRKLADVIKEN